MKFIFTFICIVSLISCQGDSKNSNLQLSNFIKPDYAFKQSSLNCLLEPNKTLNSVEQFIPKLIDSFTKTIVLAEELYFLFPIEEDKIDTKSFKIMLRHSDAVSLDKFNLTLTALSFDSIAKCQNFSVSSNALWLFEQNIDNSFVISEILECEYLDGFNFATMKLVLEQFTDAMIKHNLRIDILYSETELAKSNFQWINIFPSLETRKDFIKSWQALEISKEIQELFLEQSACQSSQAYRQYKVL